nr:NS2 [Big Cypress virus]
MENRSEQNRERRVFTKTILLYSTGENDFVARVCRSTKSVYYAIKVGMTTHMCVTDDPVPSAYIISISGEGAYRIMDRDESIYVMVSRDGVEVAQGRWPRYQFETVDTSPKFCTLTVKGQEVEAEVKVGCGAGTVKPYTEGADFREMDGIKLPGIKFLSIEGDVRETRAKLKEERAHRNEVILGALKESHADRGIARFMGLRGDQIIHLGNGPTKVEVGSARDWGRSPTPTTSAFTPVQQPMKPLIMSSTHVNSNVDMIVPGVKAKLELGFKEPPVAHTEDSFTDEYRNLITALEGHPDVKGSHDSVSFINPQRFASYENTLFEMQVKLNMVPLYTIDVARNEYKYMRMGKAERITVVLQGGHMVALPEA